MPALRNLLSIYRQTFVSERDESVNPENLIDCNLSNKATYLDFDAPCPWLSMTRLTNLPPSMGTA